MNRGGKKGIIIAIILILCVAILAVGGFLVYAKTDLFHSNQELFFKYMGQVLENFEYVENTQMTEMENLKETIPYQVTGKLTYEPAEESTNSNSKILGNMELNVTANVNQPEEKAYAKTTLNYQNEDLFTLEYANSNNIHALKSDEIVTAFLGIENDNLKVLMQKLGLLDTSIIPNVINEIDMNQLFSITEEEKTHIKDTYINTLTQNISEDSFSKDTNLTISREGVTYQTTAYRLTLTAEEFKTIQIALLQTLQQDSITLNLLATKAKLLGLNENYTQVNNLNNEIQKQIKQISNETYLSNEGISIAIYVEDGKVITTEMIVRNEVKCTIYSDIQENLTKRHLSIENLSTGRKIDFEQTETRRNNQTIYNITVNFNHSITAEIYIENIGDAQEQAYTTNIEVMLSQNETNSGIIYYTQEMNFQNEVQDMIELTNANCAVLNQYTTEQLQPLLESIYQRILTVLEQKKQAIGWQDEIILDFDTEMTNQNQDNNIESSVESTNEEETTNNTIMIPQIND